jgi:ectoine hydroxylase-related dioxygenase (phytanoyl-CoA dioxygenase family)
MPTPPIDHATDEIVERYWRDGAVYLRQVFDPTRIDRLRETIEAVRADPGPEVNRYVDEPESGKLFFNVTRRWPEEAGMRAFIRESGVTELAARFARAEKLNLLWDSTFYRTPGCEQPTPWHQDAPYWPFEGNQIVSVWIPLDPVSDTSVLGFLRGSHRMGRFSRANFRDGGKSSHFASDREDALPVPPLDMAANAEYDILRAPLEPGDCAIFHGFTLHGCPGNMATDRPLRAATFRFAGEDVRYAERPEGTSPSFPDCSLHDGDLIDCETFPAVWRQDAPGVNLWGKRP